MATKDRFWGSGNGADIKKLQQLVDQLDRTVINLEARMVKLEAGSMKAVVTELKGIRRALENPPDRVTPEMAETVKKILAEYSAQQAKLGSAANPPKKEEPGNG